MNHIYRLVWSKSRNALIAVSELTSSRRRMGSSGTVRGGKSARLLSAVLIGAGGFACVAGAHAQSTGDVKLDDLQSLVSRYDAPVRAGADVDRQGVGAVPGAQLGRVLSGVTGAVSGVPVVGSVSHEAGEVVHAVTSTVPRVLSRVGVPLVADRSSSAGTSASDAEISRRARALGIADAGQVLPAVNQVVERVVGATSKVPVVGSVVGKAGEVLGSVTSGAGTSGDPVHGVIGGLVGATSKLPLVGQVVAKVGDAVAPVTSGGGGSKADLGSALGKVVGGVVNTAATLPVAGPTVASVGAALKTATSGGSLGGGLEGQAGQVVGNAVGTLARTPGVGKVVAEVGSLLEKTTADIGQGNGGAKGVSGLVGGLVDATSKVPVVGPVVGKVGGVLESATSGTGNPGGAVTGVVNGVVDATSKVPVVGPVVATVGGVVGSVTSGTGNPGGAVTGVVNDVVDATSKVPVVGPLVATVGGVVGSATSGTGNAGGAVSGVIDGLVDATSQLPVVGPVVGQLGQTLTSVTSGLGGLSSASASSSPTAEVASMSQTAAMSPMAVPVVPAASSVPSGLVVSNGGVVGTVNQLLGTTENGLFNNSNPNGYVKSGGLQVSNANFSQGYSTLSLLGLPLLNTTPVGTLLTTVGGTVLGGTGSNSHLTLVGAVTSGNYISNINNGAAGGLLGLVLPKGAPAWASSCLNAAGLLTESCWAVNAAQDRQVLMGDGASANGSNEVVIGTGASHTLPTVDACTAFPGSGRNDAKNPCGVPTADYATRLGHSVVIGDGASGTADGQTVIGAEASASAANSVALGHQSVASRGAQTGYTAYGMTKPQNSAGEVSVGSPGQERQITNVAAGSADTDAVNVAQLRSVQSTADNSVQYDDASKAKVTLAGTASTDGGNTNGTTITNLHQGALNADSTDAVNGSQLWHWTQDTTNIYSNYSLYNSIKNLPGPGGTGSIKYFNVNSTLGDSNASGENAIAVGPVANASGNNSVAMGNGATASADNSVALGSGSVADRANTVSVGSSGNERQIANVAAGTETTDAANVGQVQQAVNWANAYTDQRFDAFNQQLNRLGRHADAGIAGAMAMAGLPQAYLPGKSMAAVAAGTYRGESSLAIGISTISEGGRWVYKLTGSTNTRGDAGVTIGAGMQW